MDRMIREAERRAAIDPEERVAYELIRTRSQGLRVAVRICSVGVLDRFYGPGSGFGFGFGSGDGDGYGYGSGSGDGYADGSGDGYP